MGRISSEERRLSEERRILIARRLQDSMEHQTTAGEVQTKLNAHEDICAIRYAGIERQFAETNARLKRIESIYIKIGGTVILMMMGGYAYLIDTIKQLLGA